MSSVPPPTLERPTAPPAGPTDQLKEIKVTGRLTEPVPGCLVIEGPGGRWELTGLPADLGPGDEVSAVGRLTPDRESRCGFPVIRVIDLAHGS
jgi:hypothetical protein